MIKINNEIYQFILYIVYNNSDADSDYSLHWNKELQSM